jgi:UDP-N-acetylglucosamine pyrophosphorylase
MTSTKTYDEVANWLGASLLQGFPKPRVILLRQADRPRLDSDGDLIADETGSIVKTGDGHGGVFKALLHPDPRGGTLRGLLVEKGVRSLVMHNVDNVMARPLDPLRIGFHVRSGVRFTLTAVERRPGERVGIICRNRRTRRIEVLEYSVCPKEVCDAVDSIGRLRFNLAHINTNLVDLRCVRADLPSTLYTAKPYTVAGRDVSTSTWEMLNQHLVSLLPVPDAGVLLVDRDTYFLPIKSQHGADSLDTSMATQCAVDASRLRQACATVADTACVELDPCVDATVDSLDCRGWIVESGARLYLGIRGGPEGTPPIGPGFRLGRGAELQVAADLPYGELRLDERNGSIRVDPGTTPTCRFGHTITLKPGVVMRIRIRGNGSVLLPDNTTIGASINVDVASGTHQTIAGSR